MKSHQLQIEPRGPFRLDLTAWALRRRSNNAAIERLTSLRGIGRWTAEYVLLRGLGRLHVFPGDDVGAHNKLRHLFGIDTFLDYEAVHQLVARWHPYAGVVYFHLLLTRCPGPASWLGHDEPVELHRAAAAVLAGYVICPSGWTDANGVNWCAEARPPEPM